MDEAEPCGAARWFGWSASALLRWPLPVRAPHRRCCVASVLAPAL